MTLWLVRKLLRDVRVPLVVVALLLAAFQCLWAKVTQRITEELIPNVTKQIPFGSLLDIVFSGPGAFVRTLIGGDVIDLRVAPDVLSIGYVHPLVQVILCIWAIGRSASAVAGEIDRGTMELLLAQPLPRWRLILAHFLVDLMTIPVLCLSLWAGNWLGLALFGQIELNAPAGARELRIDPLTLLPALANVAGLVFAVSGYTLLLSAAGRFGYRVLGTAVLLTLIMFLVNLIGQLWDGVAPLRPFTVFYYYQPQQVILQQNWMVDLGVLWGGLGSVHGLAVLLGVGAAGYGLALWTFCRRDLPAPL